MGTLHLASLSASRVDRLVLLKDRLSRAVVAALNAPTAVASVPALQRERREAEKMPFTVWCGIGLVATWDGAIPRQGAMLPHHCTSAGQKHTAIQSLRRQAHQARANRNC